MFSLFVSLLTTLCSSFRTRAAVQLEILALRHQINVLRRSQPVRALTHLPRNDIPSGILSSKVTFYVQHTLFPQFATIERISFSRNRAFVRCDLKTLELGCRLA